MFIGRLIYWGFVNKSFCFFPGVKNFFCFIYIIRYNNIPPGINNIRYFDIESKVSLELESIAYFFFLILPKLNFLSINGKDSLTGFIFQCAAMQWRRYSTFPSHPHQSKYSRVPNNSTKEIRVPPCQIPKTSPSKN